MEIWMRFGLLAVRFWMCHVCWSRQSSPVMWHFMFWCVVHTRVFHGHKHVTVMWHITTPFHTTMLLRSIQCEYELTNSLIPCSQLFTSCHHDWRQVFDTVERHSRKGNVAETRKACWPAVSSGKTLFGALTIRVMLLQLWAATESG